MCSRETHWKNAALGRTGEFVVIYLAVGWKSSSVPNARRGVGIKLVARRRRAGLNALKKLQVRCSVPKLRRISTGNYLTLAGLSG